MALNPLIALQVQTPDIAGSLAKGAETAQTLQANKEKIAQEKIKTMSERDKSRLESSLFGALQLDPYLQSGNTEGALNFLNQRRQYLGQRIAEGDQVDTTETDDAIRMIKEGKIDELKPITSQAKNIGITTGLFKPHTNGGVTGLLVDKYMTDNPGASFTDALFAVQSGLRNGLNRDSGVITNAPGYVDAKRAVSYGETGGKKQAEVDVEGRNSLPQKERAMQSFQDSVGNVNNAIKDAEKLAGTFSTGLAGKYLQGVPGTDAHDLQQALLTIKSNVGFDRLQQMRNNSPTGGALGAVSDIEGKKLDSSIAALEQSQSQEQFRKNLQRVQDQYDLTVARTKKAYEEDVKRFGAANMPSFFTDAPSAQSQIGVPANIPQENIPTGGTLTMPGVQNQSQNNYTEEDIQHTMKLHGLTRQQVLQRIGVK